MSAYRFTIVLGERKLAFSFAKLEHLKFECARFAEPILKGLTYTVYSSRPAVQTPRVTGVKFGSSTRVLYRRALGRFGTSVVKHLLF